MSVFAVMHLAELCFLDGVVGIKRVRGTIDVVVVGVTLNFHSTQAGRY
jgi:hypothetical protein